MANLAKTKANQRCRCGNILRDDDLHRNAPFGFIKSGTLSVSMSLRKKSRRYNKDGTTEREQDVTVHFKCCSQCGDVLMDKLKELGFPTPEC